MATASEVRYLSQEEIQEALRKEPVPYTGPQTIRECPGCSLDTPNYVGDPYVTNPEPAPCELCLLHTNVELLDAQIADAQRNKGKPKRKARAKRR